MTDTRFSPRKGMSTEDITQTVEAILSEATLAEKVGMMSGKGFFRQFAESGRRWGSAPYRAGGGIERLGVPALYFTDGPRGVARGNSTCFPCSMARGASFDPDLERRIGEAMGIEARAQGCNLSGAVCVNLLRHPAWGRAQETYGEDPHHVGEMGAALAQGIQTHNVIATVKHFAANSIENARFKVDVQIEARALREVYLPHFKRILDAGCASVMSAYNKINGEYCGQNGSLLTGVLRDRWGFEGFVHSDWVLGVYDVSGTTAGLDIENPEPRVWGKHLIAAVESGAISTETIDQACRRILTTLYRFAAADDPLPDYPLSLVSNSKHVALAREAALKSAVLLKNAHALPFARKDVQKLAVLGRLAALENTGDNGSSRVQPRYVVTALAGLTEAIAPNGVVLRGDERDLVGARAAAEAADAVVVVVGYTAREEGEYVPGDIALGQDGGSAEAIAQSIGGDRTSLRLPPDQVDLIQAIAGANPRMVIVLIAGSAVMIDEWVDGVPAVLQTFYAGMEGGAALASLLFGDESPSGKLPFTVPQQTEDLPEFDKDADAIVYDLWHGYWKLSRDERRPAFPFGFGLSYASFSYRALRARRTKGCLEVQVSIRNLGAMPATEVAQLYVGPPGKEVDRPKLLLRGFERVRLDPEETRTVRFAISLDSLRYFDPEKDDWVLETGRYEIFAGGSSDTTTLVRTHIVI
jgi:beta-glucosidase